MKTDYFHDLIQWEEMSSVHINTGDLQKFVVKEGSHKGLFGSEWPLALQLHRRKRKPLSIFT